MLEKFKSEMISAMKSKDKVKLNTLRAVKGAIQLEVINNKKEESDELLIEVINKQIKMRNDSIMEFEKAGRDDLVNSYKSEVIILEEYMPKKLSLDEINSILDDAISKVGASDVKDLGLVMREVTPKLKNRCDMKSVTGMLRDKLSK